MGRAPLLEDSEKNYENPYRQSSVLPYRIGPKGLEIMMITSIKRRRWILPKGIVEPDMTPESSAAKEAFEEAGVEGKVSAQRIGRYRYKKWGETCSCDVFPMRVTKVHKKWLEQHERSRAWVPANEALKRLRHKDLRNIVRKFVEKRRDRS